MAHQVETMAYSKSGGVPWHGLGHGVDNSMTVEQMLVAAGLDWKVEKKALYFEGSDQLIPDRFALVRNTDKRVLDIVGKPYVPVQNDEAIGFFKKFTETGHMDMDTAGSLRGGQFVWGLARINSSFELVGGDRVTGNLLLMQPHKVGHALIIQFTPIRVVCMNTMMMALGSNLRGTGGSYRMPHVRKFDETARKLAEKALGIATDQLDKFREAAELLSITEIDEARAEEYIADSFKVTISDVQDPNGRHESRLLKDAMWALNNSPGADMKSAKGTLWGAFNAVTYIIDHRTGRNRDTSLAEAWIGYRSTVKRRALSLALDIAEGK